jgi:hypothetical protein
VAVGVSSGVCVGVAVCFGSAVAVGAVGAVVEATVADGGVVVARITFLTVAVAVGLMDWARWKGVAPLKNASVATRSASSAVMIPPIASGCGGRHDPGGSA